MKARLERHAQTLVGSLGRLARHPLAACMTMAVIGMSLALPLCLAVLLQNARAATASWNQAFDISVYLAKSAPAGRAADLAQQLRSRPDVAAVKIIGADEALQQFRAASGFGAALDVLRDNPLPDTLAVTPALTASTPDGTAALQRAITALTDVQIVQVDTEWVQRLDAMLNILRRLIALIGGLLGLAVLLVVGNTIRIDIVNRRVEIEVMKLVGATDGFARRPFLYTGFWYGLGGGFIALLLVATVLALLARPVAALAGLYGSRFRISGLGAGPCCAVVAVSAALSWAGSWWSATRHIRGIEPR